MPHVKVQNPAGTLMLVNGGHKMKARRKSTAKRHKKANPRRRVTVRVANRHGGHKVRHARRARRRNPSVFQGMGLIKDAAWAAVGGLGTTFARGFIPISIGGAVGDAGITAALGYGLGVLAEKFVGREAGKMIAIGGMTVAVTQLLSAFNLTPQALLAPKPTATPVKAGTGDIGVFPRGSYDPYYGSSVRLAGVSDIAAMRR